MYKKKVGFPELKTFIAQFNDCKLNVFEVFFLCVIEECYTVFGLHSMVKN